MLKTPLNKNKLWVTWSKAEHRGDGIIELKTPKFSGPVLSDCEDIPSNHNITIDLTTHLILIIPEPYEVILEWSEKISQTNTEATFNSARLKDTGLGKLSILKNTDKLLMDFAGHHSDDINRGKFLPTYKTTICDLDGVPYKFI